MSWTRFAKSKLSARGLAVQSGPYETPVEVITEEQELKNIKKITGEMDNRSFVHIFDDFEYRTIADTYTPFILLAGTTGSPVAPAIAVQTYGVVEFVGGGGDGTDAQDASQMVCHLPMKLDDVGTAIAEAMVKFDTAITNGKLFVGLTDSNTLELAFTIETASIASVATDAAGLMYSDAATAKTWHALSVNGDDDSDHNKDLEIAPKHDAWQKLRVEVKEGEAKFFIDDALVHTITHEVPDEAVNLYATIAFSTTGTARTLYADYFYVGHER